MEKKYKKHFCRGDCYWKSICAECRYTKKELLELHRIQNSDNRETKIRIKTLKDFKTKINLLERRNSLYEKLINNLLEKNITNLKKVIVEYKEIKTCS